MPSREPSTYTAADLADPTIDAATLALLAQHRPDLHTLVQQHPNCYPDLVTWIAAQEPVAPAASSPVADAVAADAVASDAAVSTPEASVEDVTAADGPVAAQPDAAQPFIPNARPAQPEQPYAQPEQPYAQPEQPYAQPAQPTQQPAAAQLPTAEEWAAQFQSAHGREPSMSEFQAAQAAGHIGRNRLSSDASMQQIGAGAKQIATGAKDFFNTHVAPAAAGAARSVQQTVTDRTSEARTSPAGWRAWLPFALPALGLLGFISAFLPAASASAFGASLSVSFMQSEDGTGVLILLTMLVVIGLGVTALVTRKKWANLAAAISAIALGAIWLLITLVGYANLGSSGSSFGVRASAGFGLILLTLVSIGLIAVGILLLIGQRSAKAPAAVGSTPAPPQYPTIPPAS